MQPKSRKNQSPRELESRMLRPAASLLRQLGFGCLVREVPYFYSVVDLFGSREGANAAVELKLSRWQKAIKQARIYQLFAQNVYLCMPAAYSGRPPRDLLRKLGIGLVAVEFVSLRPLVGSAVMLLQAEDSPILKPHHAGMMADKALRLRRIRWHRVD